MTTGLRLFFVRGGYVPQARILKRHLRVHVGTTIIVVTPRRKKVQSFIVEWSSSALFSEAALNTFQKLISRLSVCIPRSTMHARAVPPGPRSTHTLHFALPPTGQH